MKKKLGSQESESEINKGKSSATQLNRLRVRSDPDQQGTACFRAWSSKEVLGTSVQEMRKLLSLANKKRNDMRLFSGRGCSGRVPRGDGMVAHSAIPSRRTCCCIRPRYQIMTRKISAYYLNEQRCEIKVICGCISRLLITENCAMTT